MIHRTALLLAFLAIPAHAEDAKPAEAAWSLFTTHCTKYLEADTLKEISAAFAPHEAKLYTTADGALQNGTVFIEDSAIPNTRLLLFNVSTTRLDGGVIRNCTLQISGQDTDLSGLPALVQKEAAEIMGADHTVDGGFVVTDKGPEGAALHFASPEFPPERAMQLASSKNFSSITLHSVKAD